MKNKILFQILILTVAVISFLNFSDPTNQRIAPVERHTPVGNYFNTGAPQISPVFMYSFAVESFELPAFPPTGWSRFTAAQNVIMWERSLYGTLPPGWNPGFGLETTVPPGGGTAVALATYDANGPVQNDIWLVTPKIYNVQTTDSLIFWLSKTAQYVDHLDIKISKTVNNSAPAFSISIAALSFGASYTDSPWVRKAYILNQSGVNNGDSLYIGFREWVTNNISDGGIVRIDLVQGVGSLVVGNIHTGDLTPNSFGLAQNYPNPFNPSTKIYYSVPKAGNVKITVYDLLGSEITTLVNGYNLGGIHEVNFNASSLASGIYVYKMQAGDFTAVKKMTLIK